MILNDDDNNLFASNEDCKSSELYLLGRVMRQGGNRLLNVDFHLSEMDSGAAWLQGLKSRNYQHGIQTNKVALGESGNSNCDFKNRGGLDGNCFVINSVLNLIYNSYFYLNKCFFFIVSSSSF